MIRLSPVAFAVAFALATVAPVASAQDLAADQARLAARLQSLDADPALSPLAAYERLQARQSLEALAAARSKQRDDALQVARWRVETAELAARTEASRRDIERLDRERSELIVEASRQEAARARQEAERLRIQAQIQAEEAARLRVAAEEEMFARQEAETVLDGVAGDQAAKLKAARQREAELAKREAELLKGRQPAPAPKKSGSKR